MKTIWDQSPGKLIDAIQMLVEVAQAAANATYMDTEDSSAGALHEALEYLNKHYPDWRKWPKVRVEWPK